MDYPMLIGRENEIAQYFKIWIVMIKRLFD
jgi:hypothetical protein